MHAHRSTADPRELWLGSIATMLHRNKRKRDVDDESEGGGDAKARTSGAFCTPQQGQGADQLQLTQAQLDEIAALCNLPDGFLKEDLGAFIPQAHLTDGVVLATSGLPIVQLAAGDVSDANAAWIAQLRSLPPDFQMRASVLKPSDKQLRRLGIELEKQIDGLSNRLEACLLMELPLAGKAVFPAMLTLTRSQIERERQHPNTILLSALLRIAEQSGMAAFAKQTVLKPWLSLTRPSKVPHQLLHAIAAADEFMASGQHATATSFVGLAMANAVLLARAETAAAATRAAAVKTHPALGMLVSLVKADTPDVIMRALGEPGRSEMRQLLTLHSVAAANLQPRQAVIVGGHASTRAYSTRARRDRTRRPTCSGSPTWTAARRPRPCTRRPLGLPPRRHGKPRRSCCSVREPICAGASEPARTAAAQLRPLWASASPAGQSTPRLSAARHTCTVQYEYSRVPVLHCTTSSTL